MRRGLIAAMLAGWLSLVGAGAQASSPLGPAPVVESISPWVVAPGDVVTISGQHLGDDLLGCGSLLGGFPSVHFAGLDGSGDHVVQVTNAANCNNTTLRVAVPSGFSGGATVFTQDPSAPPKVSNKNLQVTIQAAGSVTPTSGTAGTQAAIVGSNLKPPTVAPNPVLQVFVGGAQQAPTAWSAASIALSPRSSGAVQAGFLVSTDALDPGNPAKLARVSVNAGSYAYVPPPPLPPPGSGPSPTPTAPGAVDNPPASGTPGIVPGGPGPLPFGTFAGDFPNLSDPTLGGSSGGLLDPANLVDSNHQFHKPAKSLSPVQLKLVANPHKTSAGGNADLTATLTLNGNPIVGAPMRLRMLTPGSDFAFTPATGVTDANGVFRARVRISRVSGDSVIQAESGLYSDQDHIQGTGGDPPPSSLRRVNTGGIVPLIALGLLAVALLAIGIWMNLRSVRPAAG